MPLLGNTDRLVAAVPSSEDFRSLWPSDDALLDGKVQEMLADHLGEASVLRSAMTTGWNALRITLKNKAVVIGDYLTKQLNLSAFFDKAGALQGVFAPIEWGNIDLSGDPLQVTEAMGRVAVPAALTALTAVPLAGQLAAAYFSFGTKLAEMLSQQTLLEMPWAQYTRGADEDLTRTIVLDTYSKKVDQTNLFRPPWNPKTEWRLGVSYIPGEKKDYQNIRGHVWAPWQGGDDPIPWRGSDGVGALPGTLRIFGQVQLPRVKRNYPAELERYFRTPKGTGPKRELPFHLPPPKINCGDFYPSAASACGSLWSLIGSNGSPDMYKVHVGTLMDEWALAFEMMEKSFVEWWEADNGNALMMAIGEITHAEARRLLGAAMEPWVAFRLAPSMPWTLGLPWDMPSNWSLVTPGMLKGGKPGDPAGRTPSIWIEEDLRSKSKNKDGSLRFPYWPYRNPARDAMPRQHRCAMWKACTADLAATANLEQILHPAAYLEPSGPAPAGYRKQPWPPSEADAAQFASAWTAIVKPALERLRKQQEACLKRTLVCAYVRPAAINSNLPMYGAFRDTTLQKLCLDMREALLTHPARYRVNLADAEAIDSEYAKKLKASGVTGSPSDFAKSYGRTSVLPDTPPPPDNEPPQGGVPFGKLQGRPGRRSTTNSDWLSLIPVVGGLALGGYYLAGRKR